MSMRKGQHEICRTCQYYGKGVTKSRLYGERESEKCFYRSSHGKALYNLDMCPKEKRKSEMAKCKTIFDLLDDEDAFRKEFALELQKAIKDSGMTQRQIVDKAGITEVSMSRYLNGARMPTIFNLMRIWRALGRIKDDD